MSKSKIIDFAHIINYITNKYKLMACKIEMVDYPAINVLMKQDAGNDVVRYTTLIQNFYSNQDYKKALEDNGITYNDLNKSNVEIDTIKLNKAFELLKETVANNTKTIKDINNSYNKETAGLFSSLEVRNMAIEHVAANMSYDWFNDNFFGINKLTSFQALINSRKNSYAKLIAGKILDKLKTIDVNKAKKFKADYNAAINKFTIIEQYVNELNDKVINNQFAIILSLNNKDFVEALKTNQIIANLLMIVDKQYEISEDEININIEDGRLNEDSDETDSSTFGWQDKNTKLDYNDHVENVVKAMISTIAKCTSTDVKIDTKGNKVYAIDSNNDLGLPQFIDSGIINTILFTKADKSNAENFLNSILKLSNEIKGAEGLIILYDRLNNNRGLLNKFMMVYNKWIPEKYEFYIDDNGNAQSRIINQSAHPETYLRDIFIYNIKSISTEKANDIKNKISWESIEKEKNKLKILIDEITKVFPEIDSTVITNFINDKNLSKKDQGYKDFIAVINNLLDAAIIYNKNKTNYWNLKPKDRPDDYEFLSKLDIASIANTAEDLKPYMLISVPLNSRNVKGNLSSDPNNANYIGNFNNILNNSKALSTYTKQKFAGTDYKYATVLTEKILSDGTVMPGIFRKVGDKYTLTEYAKTIFGTTKFDGVADYENNSSELYKELNSGDYLLASLIAFTKSEEVTINNKKIRYAPFMLSVPSDAPNQFGFKMPIYGLTGLYDYQYDSNEVEEQAIADATERFNKIFKDKRTSDELDFYSRTAIYINNDTAFALLNNNENTKKLNLRLGSVYKNNQGKVVYFYRDHNETVYAVTGTFVNDNGRQYLTDATTLAIGNAKNYPMAMQNTFNEYKTYAINSRMSFNPLVINNNHPIFKAVKDIIYQEILDYYNYAKAVFKTDDKGYFIIENGNLVINDIDENEFYLNAHKDKKGNIYKLENGHYKLLGNFAKLTTLDSRFAKLDRYKKLIGDNDAENAINILYGGTNTKLKVVNGELQLNHLQETAVNKAVEEWIESYLNNGSKYIRNKYKEYLSDKFTDETIKEYIINHFIRLVDFDYLFNGKSKYYKGSQDVLKRLKEVQASGAPFGNIDFSISTMDAQEDENYPKVKFYDGKEIDIAYVGNDGRTKLKTVTAKKQFKAVTIYNTNKPSDEQTLDRIRKKLESANVDESAIRKLMYPFGYVAEDEKEQKDIVKTKTNDAQSYITFDEWVRRIDAAGELDKYRKLIEALTSNTPLEDINWSEINNRVQVQKNFYFDLYYNAKLGIEVPRQIKNAEFVLIPKLIRGTQLEDIYNIMMENGIDQLNTIETSKAGNHNILTLWDNNGVITDENRQIFNDTAAKNAETFSYNFLYRQQEVPQHMEDTKNKIGLQISKKVLDNISTEGPLGPVVNKINRNRIANIRESFTNTCDMLGIKYNNDYLDIDESGNVIGLNKSVFTQLMKENAARSGADNKTISALTTNEEGESDMPLYATNVATKLESVFGGVFNSNITRQTINGWHAAQVADFGFNVDKHTERDSKLKYSLQGIHNGIPVYYAEIKLPRWCKELQGIDINDVPEECRTMIGYRIPTEGKQSIVIMKVVDFLPEAYGSTVVLPEEWVTQTGSDFDVDSVYSMVYALKRIMIEKDSKKIPSATRINEDDYFVNAEPNTIESKKGYIKYVRNHLDKAARKTLSSFKGKLNDTKEYIKEQTEKKKAELLEEQKERIAESIDNIFKNKSALFNTAKESNNKELFKIIEAIGKKDKNQKYKIYFAEVINKLNSLKNTGEVSNSITYIDAYIAAYQAALDMFDQQKAEINELYLERNADLKQAFEDSIDEQFIETEKFAKESGIINYDEWLKLPVEERIDKDVRSNNIIDGYIQILSSEEAAEETSSISQFETLGDANAVYQEAVKEDNVFMPNKIEKFEESHDPIIQLDWKEKAGAAIQLKGISVNLDTANSIFNIAKAITPVPIKVIYSTPKYTFTDIKNEFKKAKIEISNGFITINHDLKEDTVDKKIKKLNIKKGDIIIRKNNKLIIRFNNIDKSKLKYRYGTENYIDNNDTITITHDKIGWSNDNKSINGTLVTVHSSETTAHILDVMKIGSVINENEYSFGMFKIMPSLGIDYDTAVCFMAQPAVTAVVEQWKLTNSFTYSRSNNPYTTIVYEYAKYFNLNVNNGLDSVFNEFKRKHYEFIEENYGDVKNPALNQLLITERINGSMNEETKKLHDFVILMQMQKLTKVADMVNEHIRVLTSDKFGAKQTFYATEEIFRNIDKIVNKNKNERLLNNKGEGLIESIYPDIDKGIYAFAESDINNNSSYPTLAAFLKYSSLTSILVGQNIFETSEKSYMDLVHGLSRLLKNGRMTEKIAKDFSDYLVSKTMSGAYSSPVIIAPISIDDNRNIIIDKNAFGENSNEIIENEFNRIAGLNKKENDENDFTVNNIVSPTKEEINKFLELTPAEKINWIKQNLQGDKGLFEYLEVNKFNERSFKRNGYSVQEIYLKQKNVSNNVIYELFNNAYLNKNPLIRLAAIDLVKYSFVIEGNNFGANKVSRAITILPFGNFIDNGMSIGFYSRENMRNYRYITPDSPAALELYIGYARLNYDNFPATFINIDKVKKENKSLLLAINTQNPKAIIINTSGEASNRALMNERIVRNKKAYPVLRLKVNGKTKLYFGQTIDDTEVRYYPLNKLAYFERNKTIEDSMINKLNINPSFTESYYGDYFNKLYHRASVILNIDEKDLRTVSIGNTADTHSLALELVRNDFDVTNEYVMANGKLNGAESNVIYHNEIDGNYYISIDMTKELYQNAAKENVTINQNYKELAQNYPNRDFSNDVAFVRYDKTDDKFYENLNDEDDNIMYSSINEDEDLVSAAIKQTAVDINKQARHNDEIAKNVYRSIHNSPFDFLNTDAIKSNVHAAAAPMANYIELTVDRLMNDIDNFALDATTGEKLAIDDMRVIKNAVKDLRQRNRLLNIILTARNFKNRFEIYNNIETEGLDQEVKQYIETIKKAINTIDNNTKVKKAMTMFLREFIKTNTTNPNIINGLIDPLENFTDINVFDRLLQDIKFNPNTIVQNIIKETNAIVKEAELKGKQEARKFLEEIDKIQKDYASKGITVNINKVIDNNKLLRPYSEKWQEKINELQNEYIEAIRKTKDRYSIEALRKLWNKKDFLARTKESQFQIIKYEDDILFGNKTIKYETEMSNLEYDMLANHPDIYVEYKRLVGQQAEILQKIGNGIPNEEQSEKLYELYAKIGRLTMEVDDDLNPRPFEEVEEARALKAYLTKTKALRDLFFVRMDKDGFRTQLERNLSIVETYEDSGKPVNVLMKIDEYRIAKLWLRQNVNWYLNKDLSDKLIESYSILNDVNKESSVLKNLTKQRDARDEFGIIDGTKFTDEDIDKIRRETLSNFSLSKNSGLPYAGILRTRPEESIIYTQEFKTKINNKASRSQEEIDIIEKINNILYKGWNAEAQVLNTASSNFSIDDLKRLKYYLDKYHDIHEGNKSIGEFIEDECKVITDDIKFKEDRVNAKNRGEEFNELWESIFARINDAGDVIPNTMFYGTIEPINKEKYIDKRKTEALRFIKEHTKEVYTEHYIRTKKEKQNTLTKKEYAEWYKRNHYYNPYTMQWIPLRIWTTIEYYDDNNEKAKGSYEPKIHQTKLLPRKEMINPDWKENSVNYKQGSNYNGVSYDNEKYNDLNEGELKVLQLMTDVMMKYAFTSGNENFVKNGYLPALRKNPSLGLKDVANEVLGFLGFSSNLPYNFTWRNLEEITFNNDYVIPNPMLSTLVNKNTQELEQVPSAPANGETVEEFMIRKNEIIQRNKVRIEENNKIHNDLANNNWKEVFKTFIEKSSHYNATQTVKYLLYFADESVMRYSPYSIKHNKVEVNRPATTEEEIEYKRNDSKYTSDQIRNHIRRLVFEMYKDNKHPKLTRIASIAQNMSGTKYMMLNITGGIANILTGHANIGMERLAREAFSEADYKKGLGDYMAGVTSYMAGMYKEESTTLQDGLIKLAHVIDTENYLEITDKAKELIKRTKGLLFTTQTAGEHQMQNSVLLTMMNNHRIVEDADGNYSIMSLEMYRRDSDIKAFRLVATDEQMKAYNDFFNKLQKDVQEKYKYALYKHNYITDFINNNFTLDQKRQYIKERKRIQKELKKKFETENPTLRSQFELEKGFAVLKKDSKITYKDFAYFCKKVEGVNKKIHGVYDKLGGAMLENYFIGGIIMQFHKHLYPGFKKRYRFDGYYDEELETIEKGSYTSLINFLSIPFQNVKWKNDDGRLEALQGIQNVFKNVLEFGQYINIYYGILPENERANIRRNWSEVLWVAAGVVASIALTAAAGDDDEIKESITYNLGLYSADRLVSEAISFNPFGLYSEGKKLYSNPAAIISSVNDTLKAINFSAKILLNENFEYEYTTGRYAGYNKFMNLLLRNAPGVRGVYRITDLPNNNSYYKLTDNPNDIIPIARIAHALNEDVEVNN